MNIIAPCHPVRPERSRQLCKAVDCLGTKRNHVQTGTGAHFSAHTLALAPCSNVGVESRKWVRIVLSENVGCRART